MKSAHRGVSVLLVSLVLATPAPRTVLRAQPPRPRADSLPRRPGCFENTPDSPILALAAVLAAAPPVLLTGVHCLPPEDDSIPLGFWRSHVALSATGGPAFNGTSVPTWEQSANVELFSDGVYVEFRLESFYLPELTRYRTARIGFLVHPYGMLASGVTVGARAGTGPEARSGVELGLPLVWGGRRSWTRFEPTYVIGGGIADWSYRFQQEFQLRGGPLYTGYNAEWRAFPLQRGGHVAAFSSVLLIGVRR
jgi:hypothetical protein